MGVGVGERRVTGVDFVGVCDVVQLLLPGSGRDGRIGVCKKRLGDRCLRMSSDERSVGYAYEKVITCLN